MTILFRLAPFYFKCNFLMNRTFRLLIGRLVAWLVGRSVDLSVIISSKNGKLHPMLLSENLFLGSKGEEGKVELLTKNGFLLLYFFFLAG